MLNLPSNAICAGCGKGRMGISFIQLKWLDAVGKGMGQWDFYCDPCHAMRVLSGEPALYDLEDF